MVLLQNKLNLRVSQKQILTPGLVQMVSVLALNKLELKEMINAEIVENPVLEELESSIPLIDQVAGREADRERADAPEQPAVTAGEQAGEKKDPFEEIDFGTYFKDYLDPGFRSPQDFESSDRPSFQATVCRTFSTRHYQVFAMPQGLLFLELRTKPGAPGNPNTVCVLGPDRDLPTGAEAPVA